mmetsp:Transcript_78930/g.118637  ORF Transcript_78930/g.118637 Transcript_78930/m.118637 type:complete len:266 (+) Transcript_78930:121-918(+)|eukprot:CAMPEP_0117035440 /NCGR_PEP_ID=MMETSP0472-20121206/25167_1 /TAXON_ID=693140 ORGANISM="Tiarina fusus, Strain LIS" /NCGR_SAMPLE_ID=MMETSP0472 /ASSEMBLY_ACC=CAM_ASM_000603 /LENGTH=265 /DNA_ID=CAMNT_0004744905 /DNA_START=120 /DNA_END=917 /DNA_ORIENTATION=-
MTMKDHQSNLRTSLQRALCLVTVWIMKGGHGFTVQPNHLAKSPLQRARPAIHFSKLGPAWNIQNKQQLALTEFSKTRLDMYNLPPGGGGGGGNNELADIAKGAFGLVLVVAFFASPIGGFIFGIFNSILLLSILTPIILTLAFQAWQYFNTIDAPCPNCAAPAKALKTNSEGEATPTVCYNCGAILQANYDNTAIDNVTGRNSVNDDGGMDINSIFDIFGGGPGTTTTTTTTTTMIDDVAQKETRRKREQTVIDVEVERDDKPWQ